MVVTKTKKESFFHFFIAPDMDAFKTQMESGELEEEEMEELMAAFDQVSGWLVVGWGYTRGIFIHVVHTRSIYTRNIYTLCTVATSVDFVCRVVSLAYV